jgi:hypothetical protein
LDQCHLLFVRGEAIIAVAIGGRNVAFHAMAGSCNINRLRPILPSRLTKTVNQSHRRFGSRVYGSRRSRSVRHRITPAYSPISTPNSPAFRSLFRRVSSDHLKNIAISLSSAYVLYLFYLSCRRTCGNRGDAIDGGGSGRAASRRVYADRRPRQHPLRGSAAERRHHP